MLNWSNWGQGSCPQCRSPYSSSWKLANCSMCGYELGGSASAKVPKLSYPLAVRVHGDLFSTRTRTRDDHCFVLKEGDFWICLHTECKIFAPCMYRATGLQTSHVRTLKVCQTAWTPVGCFQLRPKKLPSIPDCTTKELLKKLVVPVGHQAVYKVTDSSYVVYGPPSATNTLGFCHVKMESV